MNVRDQFEIVGPLGADAGGAAVFLARDRAGGGLVGLRSPAGQGAPMLVMRTLDANMPAGERTCPICRARVTDWRRFCGRCGSDISGVEPPAAGDAARELLSSALRATGRPLEVLGDMPRAEGGAPVYFARDTGTGEIVAVTLERPASGAPAGFGLGLTAFLPARSGAATSASGAAAGPLLAASAIVPAVPPPVDADVKVCPACGAEYSGATRFCPRDGSGLRGRDVHDELIGQVIADRYHVLRRLGHGGMGQVYLAEHVKMGRTCALKVMHRALSQDVNAVTRFAREASSASRINHPNVATIYDFGETRDRLLYLVMEYVEGEALAQVLLREKRLSAGRAVGIAAQIADALGAAHREGVVHRDLKPDNILITRGRGRAGRDAVKVVDFGIAKAIREGADGLTRTGLVVGTPRYMSPEQLLGAEMDGRSDLYSLGCILFEMLAGGHPFGAHTGDRLITARLSEPTPRLRQHAADVAPSLEEVVARAMAKDPGERYPTAEDMRDDLEAALASAAATGGPLVPAPADAVAVVPRSGAVPTSAPEPASTPATAWPPETTAVGASESATHKTVPDPAQDVLGPRPGSLAPAPSTDRGVAPAPSRSAKPRRPLAAGIGLLVLVAGGAGLWASLGRPDRETPDSSVMAGDGAQATEDAAAAARDPAFGAGPPVPAAARPAADSARTVDSVPTRGAEPSGTRAADQGGAREAARPATPEPARLRLVGTLPEGARLIVDGSVVPRPADGILLLPPGVHDLRVEAAGHRPATLRRDLAAGALSQWQPRLERLTEERRPADPPPAQGAQGATPVASRSFAEVARAEIERVARELESGQIRPSMPATLEAEWRRLFQQGATLRIGVREIQTDSAAATATFLLVVADGNGRTLISPADYEASFLRLAGGWRLTELFRR